MALVFLTSVGFIKSMTNLSNNEHDKFLNTAIRESQEMGLQSIIGTRLYKKLQSLVEDDTIDNSGNESYKELIDIAQWYLAYEALSKLCVITNIKLDNVGLYQTSDEHMSPISVNDTFKIKDFYENKANFYKKRIQEFCCENHSKLTELGHSKYSEMHSNLYASDSSSIFLGGVRGKRMFEGYLRCHR